MPEQPLIAPAAALRAARSVVVLTGAGVSAESGIRTFRDTMEGLWKSFDPATLATPEAFRADPENVTRWYDMRRQGCLACDPNPGHIALTEIERRLERAGGRFTLLTQNVDRLHQKAGSRNVVELHGSIMVWRCTRTGRLVQPPPEPFTEFPPRSETGAPMRPDVVWFGEALPEAALQATYEALRTCDLIFSIGTSGVVQPAASFVEAAIDLGARAIEINRDPTPITRRVDWSLQGRSGEILPRLVELAYA